MWAGGIHDSGSSPAQSRRSCSAQSASSVFLDYNDNGLPDPGEPVMETDAGGRYLFGGLNLTRYKVRQDLRRLRVRQTTPQQNAPYVVDLTPQNSSIPDKDFGVRILPLTGGTRPKPTGSPPLISPPDSEEPQNQPPKKGPGPFSRRY